MDELTFQFLFRSETNAALFANEVLTCAGK